MGLTHRHFLEVASVIASASTCLRGQVGAVIVQDRRAVSMGYNGAPPGMPHCMELGCQTGDYPGHVVVGGGCQRAIHAELNAIAWAARHGVATDGGTIYCTHGPCLKCAQAILAAGIVEVHYIEPYRLDDGVNLLIRKGFVYVEQHEPLER